LAEQSSDPFSGEGDEFRWFGGLGRVWWWGAYWGDGGVVGSSDLDGAVDAEGESAT